jgi:hypothetical protein
LHKNTEYGNAALEPMDIFKIDDIPPEKLALLKLYTRFTDKFSRIKKSKALKKNDTIDALGYDILTIIKKFKLPSEDFERIIKIILDEMFNINKLDNSMVIDKDIMPKEKDKIFNNKAGATGKALDLILSLLLNSVIPPEYKVFVYIGKLLIDIALENEWVDFKELMD